MPPGTDAYSEYSRRGARRRRNPANSRSRIWPESCITTALGAERGMDSSRELDRIYRATMQAMADGLILGRGRHGVVVALTNDPSDPRFSLAVKIVSKVFVPSKNREGSFHRVVSHTLHVQNEVAAMAKLSDKSNFVLPLYCALQDDAYVYLVMERACCSLKQLIQHADEVEERQLLSFQEDHALKFLSFCTLTSAALLHAAWTMARARLVHHDIHPAQILVTSRGRPCLADLGQCSVIAPDGRKTLLPPLGRRDFCRPAKLGPLQGAEVDGYGCGATLWVTWKGCYDALNRVQREWNRHEERQVLQERLEHLATKALEQAAEMPPPRWKFAQRVLDRIREVSPAIFAAQVREMIESLITACQEDQPEAASAPFSTFRLEAPWSAALPFLALTDGLATDPSVALEPTNFALPAVHAEEPWPPTDANMIQPVYLHAVHQLRVMEHAAQNARSRSRAVRPELPELPIPLNAEPCVSMLLHPGRLTTSSAEPMIRLAFVSMHVRDALPEEIPVSVRVAPWGTDAADEPPAGSGGDGGSAEGGTRRAEPTIAFSIFRDEFTQEGPSGPVEAKRILLVRALPMQRTRVTFEIDPALMEQLGFCHTPPLMIDHQPGAAGAVEAPKPPPQREVAAIYSRASVESRLERN